MSAPFVFTLCAAAAATLATAFFVHALLSLQHPEFTFGAALLWQGLLYFSWAAVVPIISAVAWKPLQQGYWKGAWLRLTALGVPLILAHALLSAWSSTTLSPIGKHAADMPAGMTGMMIGRAVNRLPVDLLIYLAIVGAVAATGLYVRIREEQRTASELERQLATARLQTLKMQLQPHFLFNTLNTIAVLIPRDPNAAAQMTVRLGDLLRTTLSRTGTQEVSLADEIDFIRDYLALEQVRFSDRLTVRFEVEEAAMNCQIPDLILQPLVENALRHGVEPKPGPVSIHVRASVRGDRLRLEVADDGIGLPGGHLDRTRDGVGLATTRARLETIFGSDHTFALEPNNEAGAIAIIEIPCGGTSRLRSASDNQ